MLSLLLLGLSAVTAMAKDCQFNLELTWQTGAPDGFEREMIFVNGQYPGPTLQIDEDDWVEINVANNMPFNTTVHWHGIDQINTPWADGVPGLSQRPIQPGASYTYKWYAGQYGSYFYHAHSRGQIDDGLYGPIIIKPKDGTVKPFDKIPSADVKALEAAEANVQPLILSDWRHKTAQETWDLEVASGIESSICMDSLLVNGKGRVDCWPQAEINQFTSPALTPLLTQDNLTVTPKGCIPPLVIKQLLPGNGATNLSALPDSVFETCSPTEGNVEIIKVTKEQCDTKWLALDIISAAGLDAFGFSIDQHPLWIYAVDGHYIEPLQVDAIQVSNGDRYSVFVELNQPAANYGIRVASIALAQLINTTAVLSYDGAVLPAQNNTVVSTITSTPFTNQVGANTTADVTFFNQAQMVSFPPEFPQPAPEVDQTIITNIENGDASYIWTLDGTPFNNIKVEDINPPLTFQDPKAANLGSNLTITTKNNTWVDIIFQVTTVGQPPHPIHKHSNKAFIIGSGQGLFNYTSVAEASKTIPESFNLQTPPFRDVFTTIPTQTGPTWLAIRYQVINPGAFLLHCHIQSHLNGGMAMVILDGVDEWPHVPNEVGN